MNFGWIVSILEFWVSMFFPLDEVKEILVTVSDLGLVEKSFEHNGGVRKYLEYHPQTVQEGSSMILLLQGTGLGPGALFTPGIPTYDRLLPIADERGILLLAPFAEQIKLFGFDIPFLGGAWNDYGKLWLQTGADDVGFLESLVQFAIQEYGIDPSRVFISGISGGSTMTYRMLNERSALFAAAAPLLAQLQNRNDIATPTNYSPTPILSLFATDDPLVMFEGGDNMLLNDARSARDTMRYFASLNNNGTITSEPARTELDENQDGDCIVEIVEYGPDTAPVEGYIIHNNGHHVPGTDLYIFVEPIAPLFFGKECRDEDNFVEVVVVEFFSRYGL